MQRETPRRKRSAHSASAISRLSARARVEPRSATDVSPPSWRRERTRAVRKAGEKDTRGERERERRSAEGEREREREHDGRRRRKHSGFVGRERERERGKERRSWREEERLGARERESRDDEDGRRCVYACTCACVCGTNEGENSPREKRRDENGRNARGTRRARSRVLSPLVESKLPPSLSLSLSFPLLLLLLSSPVHATSRGYTEQHERRERRAIGRESNWCGVAAMCNAEHALSALSRRDLSPT